MLEQWATYATFDKAFIDALTRPGKLELWECTLEIDPGLQAACDAACEADCACEWNPIFALGECETVADRTCEDALSALAED